ncbi:MAG: hypothetical protein V1820_05495 [archaeon]
MATKGIADAPQEHKKLKITMGGIFAWLFGLALLSLAALVTLSMNFLGGLPIILAALLCIPPSYNWLSDRTNISLSFWVKALVVVILMFAGIAIGGSMVPVCKPAWSCGEWGGCAAGGVKTRVCTDGTGCNSTKLKPAETGYCNETVDEIKAWALNISYDDVVRHNEDYVGKTLYYQGGIRQVVDWKDGYHLLVGTRKVNNTYSEDLLWVGYVGERLLDEDVIDLWASAGELIVLRTASGGQLTAPEMTALHVVLVKKRGE